MRAFAVVVLALGCGGSAPPPADPAAGGNTPTRTVIEDSTEDDSGDGVEIVSARGHMDPDAVAAGIAPHAAALEACYTSNLKRRQWLGGKLQLTWQITKAGDVTSVVVGDSDLGAWSIEKCLLGVARAATFAKPKGGDADFSLPFEFSAKGASVWWDEDIGIKAVGKRVDALAKCGAEGKPAAEVVITMYVGTRGKVQSAGFGSTAAVPEAWADCVAAVVEGWTLADPRGKVAKVALRYQAP
jgi:hypothetical protein